MVTIGTKWGSGYSETLCPFLKNGHLKVGLGYCKECSFFVNAIDGFVWCIGDEHPMNELTRTFDEGLVVK